MGIELGDKHAREIEKLPQLKVATFLNRLLGVPVREQQLLFECFARKFESLVRTAKKVGEYDLGIMQIESALPGNRITVKSGPERLYRKPGGGKVSPEVSLWVFTEDRSVSFAQSKTIYADAAKAAKSANKKGVAVNSKGNLSANGALGYYYSKNASAGQHFVMCVGCEFSYFIFYLFSFSFSTSLPPCLHLHTHLASAPLFSLCSSFCSFVLLCPLCFCSSLCPPRLVTEKPQLGLALPLSVIVHRPKTGIKEVTLNLSLSLAVSVSFSAFFLLFFFSCALSPIF